VELISYRLFEILSQTLLLAANSEVSLEVEAGRTKHKFMSRHHKTGRSHNKISADKSSQNLAKFKHVTKSDSTE
jgi:hypothetical protein